MEFIIMIYATPCYLCKHYIERRKCKAFEKIPDDIWEGKNDHTKKYPDQKNNIIFEPIKNK